MPLSFVTDRSTTEDCQAANYDGQIRNLTHVIEEEVRTPEIQIEEYADDIEVSESSVQTTS